MKKKIKYFICLFFIYLKRMRLYMFYRNQFKRYCKMQGIGNKEAEGEKDYKKKWGVFGCIAVR